MKDFSSSVDRVEANGLILNCDYQQLLKNFGFHSFKSVWQYRCGETIKKIKARSVVRIKARNHNKVRYLYLKRHNLEHVGIRRLLTLFFHKLVVSQGRREFENICDFRKHNFATLVPVAAGEKFIRFFWVESFLISEDFSPFISLEDLLRDEPEFLTGRGSETRKRILINEIALFLQRMHQEGFNDLDFNATHILLHYENGSDVPKIALFDLQRIDRSRFLNFRWMIKSLARLNYTLPYKIFNAEDRVYIFLSYKNRSKLHVWDRLQWFWIKRKTARIKRHTDKMMAKTEERKRRRLLER